MLTEDDLGSAEWLACLSELTRSLGRKSFEAQLVDMLNRVLPIDHCVVFTHGDDGVGHLFTHGKMPAARAQELANDYVQQYHPHDPLFQQRVKRIARVEITLPVLHVRPRQQDLPDANAVNVEELLPVVAHVLQLLLQENYNS